MTDLDLDAVDKRILLALQGDLDDSPEPYAAIARCVNLPEEEVLLRIQRLLDEGVIRRLGAMIRHIEAGIGYNGMVVWKVPPDRIEEIGTLLATFPEVTHCYERPAFGDIIGSLFTMVHAASEEECLAIVRGLSEKAGIGEYVVLFSERELKKISMTYFDEKEL
jgi:siroheme decarboxylase